MNTCILTGNLGADPESFYSPNEGTHVVTFSLAFKSTYKKEKANWIKVTCFNKNADIAEKYLHKGARVGIIGLLDHDVWETDDGEKRSMLKLIANTIEFIKIKNGDGENDPNTHLDGDDQPPF